MELTQQQKIRISRGGFKLFGQNAQEALRFAISDVLYIDSGLKDYNKCYKTAEHIASEKLLKECIDIRSNL